MKISQLTYLIIFSLCLSVFSSCGIFKSSKTQTDNEKQENFNNFYERFNSDEKFQLSRTSFANKKIDDVPVIKGHNTTAEGKSSWTINNWIPHKATVEEVDKNLYTVEVNQTSNSVNEKVIAKDGSLKFIRTFRKINGKWWLTYCVNETHY